MAQVVRCSTVGFILFGLVSTHSIQAADREAPAAFAVEATQPKRAPAAPTLATADSPPARAALQAFAWADPQRLFTLAERNVGGALPMQNGLTRELPDAAAVSFAPRDVPALGQGKSRGYADGVLRKERRGALRWATRVEVDSAYRLRLGLTDLRLPGDAQLWVVGGDGETVGPFGLELRGPDGILWTPSVAGPSIALELLLPGSDREPGSERRPQLTIGSVIEIFELDPNGVPTATPGFIPKGEECHVDAQCVGNSTLANIDSLQRAVAHLQFAKDGGNFICSGALLNDTDPSGFIPYFLTANHCFESQSSASSLEAFFDFHPSSCNGFAPGLGSLPRSNGSTLLATSSQSDFTFLRLSSAPAGRTYLGWTTTRQPIGTELHRIAHPSGKPQVYSRTRVLDANSPFRCSGRPIDNYYYSEEEFSGTAGGASGGSAFTANGQVVGQLFGVCGSDISDPCGQATKDTLDGYFGTTFSTIGQFLAPNTSSGCQANASTLCLLSGRYQARLTWTNQFNGTSGNGGAVALTDFSGLFYFADPANIELMLKVLDLGGVIKVFYGQLTNFGFTLTIRDTVTGRTNTYSNTPGNCGAIDQDFNTLSSDVVAWKALEPELPALPPCVQTANRLCLFNNRFSIEADWRNQFNGERGLATTPSSPLSQLSGTFSYTDPRNVELLVKTLDFGDRILFIWGALSDFEYTIRVTDTVTGNSKTYFNPGGQYCGGIDDNFGSGGGSGGTVAEIEPNNNTSQAQTLTGSSPLQVNGRAETSDAGQLAVQFDNGTTDDMEDLYRVTLRSTGLQIRLTGLSSDCDVYLWNSTGTTVLDGSNAGATNDELINASGLAPGTYLIGVSAYDAGGSAASNYTLRLEGNL